MGGTHAVDPFGYHAKLIELADKLARDGAKDPADLLRRFRVIYRHLAATVDGSMAELGQGPFGPMGPGMPAMPDTAKVLQETDAALGQL
jgi:hypothetical protein